jgi:hypothetical protein
MNASQPSSSPASGDTRKEHLDPEGKSQQQQQINNTKNTILVRIS